MSQAAAIIFAALIGAITTVAVSRRQVERRDDDIAEIRRTIQDQAARIEVLNASETQKEARIEDLQRQLVVARQDIVSAASTTSDDSVTTSGSEPTKISPPPVEKQPTSGHHTPILLLRLLGPYVIRSFPSFE